MSGYVGFETQFKVTSPDGVQTYYVGSQILGVQYNYTSADTVVSQYAGEPLNFGTTSVMSGPAGGGTTTAVAGTDSLKLIKTPDAATVGICAVAQSNVIAGGVGVASGPGSMVPVRATTAIVAGQFCVAAAQASVTPTGGVATTFALVKTAASATASLSLGICIKTGTTVMNQIFATVLINPA